MSTDPNFETNDSGTFKALTEKELRVKVLEDTLSKLLDAMSNLIDVADEAFDLIRGEDNAETTEPD